MSKRSKEMALKVYPKRKDGRLRDYSCTDEDVRKIYAQGYRKAEKDTIERAISVLVNLPSLVIPSNYIAYFRKKMMEEDNG